MKTLLSFFLLMAATNLFAQTNNPQVAKNAATGPRPVNVKYIGKLNFSTISNTLGKTGKETGECEDMPVDTVLERVKSEKLKQKYASIKNPGSRTEGSGGTFSNLVPYNSFEGQWDNDIWPTDNTIAVSNEGDVASVINDYLLVDDTLGNNLLFVDLSGFFQEFAAPYNDVTNLPETLGDPKIIYDALANRFILYAQTYVIGDTYNSQAIVAFSETNDPTQNWYVYTLAFDNTTYYFDYPKLALSQDELFLTGNLFYTANNNFSQSVIYQVDKAQGNVGNSILPVVLWDSTAIQGNPFTLLPLSYEPAGNQYSGIYLVATYSSYGNEINVYHISGNQYSNPTISDSIYFTLEYQAAADAMQKGSGHLLDIRDCRAQSGFYLNGKLHFVFHAEAGSGWSGIAYHRITLSSQTDSVAMFSAAGVSDYSYPAVVFAGATAADEAVLISYNLSGPDRYPGTGAVYCDNGMNFYSPLIANEGNSYVSNCLYEVSSSGDTIDRWGDYTGICRTNTSSPRYWMAGAYGDANSNQWRTWIEEMGEQIPAGVKQVNALANNVSVFPNPANDVVNVTSNYPIDEIKVEDVLGRTVLPSLFLNGSSLNQQLNLSSLATGIYFVNTTSHNQLAVNKVIVVR